jgi:hypothetical protein
MSFTERLILWLHIGVAIFTIGPATAAIMSTPRYIRKHDTAIVAFLHRITRIYAIGALLVLVLGVALAGMLNEFSKPWISISMTLFVVAVVMLFVIDRDQGRAVEALKQAAAVAAAAAAAVSVSTLPAVIPAEDAEKAGKKEHHLLKGHEDKDKDKDKSDGDTKSAAAPAAAVPAASVGASEVPSQVAAVERGRIASFGGITSLIWLAILIFMVWGSN